MTFPFQWLTCLLAHFEEGPDGELVRDENALITLQEDQPKVSCPYWVLSPPSINLLTYLEITVLFATFHQKVWGQAFRSL